MIRSLSAASLAVLFGAGLGTAVAGPANLVTNGSFEQTQFGGQSTELNNSNGSGGAAPQSWQVPNTTGSGVTGWSEGYIGNNGAFNIWWNAANATSKDANSYWTPSEHQRLDAAFSGPSPDGGNFVGLDGDTYFNGPLYQTIAGLQAGAKYKLTFDWAAVQLSNRTGATTEMLQASLGGSSYSTSVYHLPSQDFSGWMTAQTTFTATGGSEVLSFLSIGTPNGLPPMALLDGVSLTKVNTPEPASLALLGSGLLGLGLVARRRRAR